MAIGQRKGRAVIVSGGSDGTVRVWDLESGAAPSLYVATAAASRGWRWGSVRAARSSSPGAARVWCACGT